MTKPILNLTIGFLDNQDSVIYTETLIEEINEHLDPDKQVFFVPVQEKDNILAWNLNNFINKFDDSDLLDNYQRISEVQFPFEYHKKRIYVYSVPKFKHSIRIKLSNYNKLSDQVPELLRNFVFEVVDYFKRNQVTNFDGTIEFVKIKEQYFVYKLNVKENETKSPTS